jgi:hypothetical protein
MMISINNALTACVLLFSTTSALSQKAPAVFLPNGTAYIVDTSKVKTIKDYYESTGNRFLGSQELKDKNKTFIMYRPLVYEPALMFSKDSLSALKAVKFMSKAKYIDSWEFESDFKRLVDLKYTKDEIIKLLGPPSDERVKDDVYTILSYPGFSLQFIKSVYPESTFLDLFTKYKFSGARVSGLGISSFEINLSDLDNNYTTGFKGTFSNFSKKKIKYLYISITAVNAVGDLVKKKTVTAIGPILPGDAGEFSYDNIFYSSIIESVKIASIKVQYFDGSLKVITGSVLNNSFLEHH